MSELLVCTQCGFTHAEFLARGLLGCPACYACFGETLFSDILHVHPALYQRPPEQSTSAPQADSTEDAAALREKLGDALRQERYEDAAVLRQRLEQRRSPSGGAS